MSAPSVASTPCPSCPVQVIVSSTSVIAVPLPVANTPLAPVPVVFTELPVSVIVLPPLASTPASSP
jgi:hypothetical protein